MPHKFPYTQEIGCNEACPQCSYSLLIPRETADGGRFSASVGAADILGSRRASEDSLSPTQDTICGLLDGHRPGPGGKWCEDGCFVLREGEEKPNKCNPAGGVTAVGSLASGIGSLNQNGNSSQSLQKNFNDLVCAVRRNV